MPSLGRAGTKTTATLAAAQIVSSFETKILGVLIFVRERISARVFLNFCLSYGSQFRCCASISPLRSHAEITD